MQGCYKTKRNIYYHYNLIQMTNGKYFLECWVDKLKEKRSGGCKITSEYRKPTKELIDHCKNRYGINEISY